AMPFGRPISGLGIAVLGPTTGFAVTSGELKGPPPDRLWSFEIAGSSPHMVDEAGGSFTLGAMAVDATTKKLFVPDGNAETPRLLMFDVSAPAAATLEKSVASSSTGLPPRSVAWY